MTTTAYAPADQDIRDLIDRLMHDPRPARQIAQDPDGISLREAIAAIDSRDYLASGCAETIGARRVLALTHALSRTVATREQAAATYAVAAWAALALDRPAHAKALVVHALLADPAYSLAQLIGEALLFEFPSAGVRASSAATRQRMTTA